MFFCNPQLSVQIYGVFYAVADNVQGFLLWRYSLNVQFGTAARLYFIVEDKN